MEQSQAEAMQGALQKIVAKAWESDDFRASLTADPKAALSTLGYELPEAADIRVFDQTDPDTLYLNIPNREKVERLADAQKEDMELTDEQLEQVAGGEIIFLAMPLLWATSTVAVGAGATYGGMAVAREVRDSSW